MDDEKKRRKKGHKREVQSEFGPAATTQSAACPTHCSRW